MEPVEVIADAPSALVALDPTRARLLAELRVPASATELAPRVGLTRQRVNYHLRKLEAQGLVVTDGTRQWGGLTERRLVASAAGYLVSPSALGMAAAEPENDGDRLSAQYLIALAGRLIREVGGMLTGSRARPDRPPVPALAVDTEIRFRSPADRAAFADDLSDALVQLVARYHDEQAPNGRWHRVLVGVHPVPVDVAVRPTADVPTADVPTEATAEPEMDRSIGATVDLAFGPSAEVIFDSASTHPAQQRSADGPL